MDTSDKAVELNVAALELAGNFHAANFIRALAKSRDEILASASADHIIAQIWAHYGELGKAKAVIQNIKVKKGEKLDLPSPKNYHPHLQRGGFARG